MPTIDFLLPSLAGGGAERGTLALAAECAQRGVESRIVTVRDSDGALRDLVSPSVEVVDLNGGDGYLSPYRRLRDHFERRPPDAILGAMWPLTVVETLAARRSAPQARIVLVEHNNLPLNTAKRGWHHRAALTASLATVHRLADAVVTPSEGLAEVLRGVGFLAHDKVHAIPNPAYPTAALPAFAAEKEPFSGGTLRLLSVANLRWEKDFPTLLEAVHLLSKRRDVRLTIVGEGPQRGVIESRIQDLGLRKQVRLAGFVSDTGSYYLDADVFVLSSRSEGFANVLVEALAYGVQVVSTDCLFGPSEILKAGAYGQLAPTGDSAALTSAIEKAANYPIDPQRLQQRAQAFTIEAAAEAYLNLLMSG